MLKLVNCMIGMVGLAINTYSLWLIRAWQRNMPHFPPLFDHSRHHHPSLDHGMFIYTFLGLGITLLVTTCLGHVAAATANGCCLYFYMVFVFLLFMLEAGVTADIFLNRDWEEDFRDDPNGRFDQFKEFVRLNFDICKWIGLSIACVQGLSLLLAMILKALGPHPYYDSVDEYVPERVPLLKSAVLPPPYVVGDPVYGSKSDSWNMRING